MVKVSVKIVSGAGEENSLEFEITVDRYLPRALNIISRRVGLDLKHRLRLDYQFVRNGRLVTPGEFFDTKLEDNDRLLILPSLGGG